MSKVKCAVMSLVLGFAVVASGLAQDAAPNRDADHQALRELLARMTRAINSQDVKALMTCFSKEFVLTTIDQTVLTNEVDVTAYYGRMFKNPDALIAKMETAAEADVLTRFTDANTGYCYGKALSTYTMKDGRVMRMKERWTALVRKEGAEWKLMAGHMGVDFLDNPVLRIKSMSFWRKVGVFLHLAKMPTD